MKYKFVFCPGHPGVNSKGYIYEHILVAEKMLGRFLKSEEVVHHIDENKSNNTPNNLMVFATDADHTRFHRLDKSNRTLYCINDIWYCDMKLLRCQECGKEYKPIKYSKKKPQKYCSKECSQYAQRKIKNRPSKSELCSLLQTNSYCSVGKMFGVSGNTIKKWLK